MSDSILEVTKAQFEAFLELPAVKATYSYYYLGVPDTKHFADVPRSLLGRRWLKYAGVYYVVGESDAKKVLTNFDKSHKSPEPAPEWNIRNLGEDAHVDRYFGRGL